MCIHNTLREAVTTIPSIREFYFSIGKLFIFATHNDVHFHLIINPNTVQVTNEIKIEIQLEDK